MTSSWDRTLEGGLPDCRLHGPRRRATTRVLRGVLYERVFCANCGADGGFVTAEWSPHVFYLCEGCVGVAGEPQGTVRADERAVRGG